MCQAKFLELTQATDFSLVLCYLGELRNENRMTDSRHYKAFISYSHSDEHWARWLQRSLEKYKLPKTFRQSHPELPKRLYPIFRDRDELASGGDLSESIRVAMDDSDALIIICSPAARASHWVNEEIKRFKALDRGDRIFCFLVSGSPDVNSPDCAFPAAILQDENGYVIHEPLAADATPKGDGKRNAMLKVAAGLLGVGVDDLKRRDAQRQARFWSYIAMGTTFIATLTIGLAIYAFNAKKESEMRRLQAEGLIGFMLGDLRDKLEPIGKLDILDAVGDQAMNYFETLSDRGSPKEMLARAKAFKQIGEVRKAQGALEPALKAFKQSLIQSEALYKTDPSNNDYLFELGQAEFWVGYIAWDRGELDQADAAFQKYMLYSRELLARQPANSDYNMELSYAYSNVGSLARARGNSQVALDNFILSRDINIIELSKHPNDAELAYSLAEGWSWIGSTKMDLGDLVGSEQAFAEISKILRPFYKRGDNARATFTLASNMSFHTEAKVHIGDLNSAKTINAESLGILSMLTKKDPNNADWLLVLYKTKLMQLSLISHKDWSSTNDTELERLLEGASALLAKAPNISKNKIIIAGIHREIALRALQGGNFTSAIAQAESAYALVDGLRKEADKTPIIYVEYAKSAEILGAALMANKQSVAAEKIWHSAADLLDKQTIRIFDFQPIRRLLAIDLKDAARSRDIEAQLTKSGFQDPRMSEHHTLSGAFNKPSN